MSLDSYALGPALEDSIRQYQRILDYLAYMDHEIDGNSEIQSQSMVESLEELQREARELDSVLLPILNEEVLLGEQVRSGFSRREEVIRKVILINAEIERKAQGAQSLLAHELETLRHGQKAISGYKPQQSSGGRIVNSTS